MTDHENIVTVFGGTGFLGQRIVSRLLDKAVDVRAASRHPHKISGGASGKWPSQQIEADILDPSSIAAAVVGSRAVVNAVSLYVERGEQTFERVHVKAATDLATASRDAGVESLSRFRASARIRSPVLTTSAPGAAARRL